jgi:hypothetical protein
MMIAGKKETVDVEQCTHTTTQWRSRVAHKVSHLPSTPSVPSSGKRVCEINTIYRDKHLGTEEVHAKNSIVAYSGGSRMRTKGRLNNEDL